MFRHLAAQSAIMLASLVVVSLFSYAFTVYIARSLGPKDYGAVGALLSIFSILSLTLGPFTMVIIKFAAQFQVQGGYGKVRALISVYLGLVLRFGTIVLLGGSLVSPLIADFLQLPSIVAIVLTTVFVVSSLALSVTRAVLQGLQHFGRLALVNTCESAFRLALGLALVLLGLGVEGAILAYAIATVMAFGVSLHALRGVYAQEPANVDRSALTRYSVPVFAVGGYFALATNIDMIVVRHYLAAEDAGIYAAASTVARVLTFLTAPFSATAFPAMADQYARGKQALPVLKQALLLYGPTVGPALAVLWLAPSLVVQLIFGPQYQAAASLVGPLSLATLLVNVAGLQCAFLLAVEKTSVVKALLAGVALESALLWTSHESPLQVAYVLIISFAAVLALLFFGEVIERETRRWIHRVVQGLVPSH